MLKDAAIKKAEEEFIAYVEEQREMRRKEALKKICPLTEKKCQDYCAWWDDGCAIARLVRPLINGRRG